MEIKMFHVPTHPAEGCSAALCKIQTAPDCNCPSFDPDEQKHIYVLLAKRTDRLHFFGQA